MGNIRVKYEFDEDNPEDMVRYRRLLRTDSYWTTLHEIFQETRKKYKYLDKHDKTAPGWEEAYDLMWEIADDNDLKPWDDIFGG